ncbi:hypothetical protein SAMN02927921_04152 [Sinomicrobium oceani]|uniref:Uncharacterized protein n=1 Tax=Sinomicrobium oceani TaxID=1150368 RepID=A0A1K1RY81_9FLAO|nr:hypothetical protein [Sinomicrobium oceani]SFW76751.1 hypothetical protein SAMN02927921_04152 [Sinomicrobium oceani]
MLKEILQLNGVRAIEPDMQRLITGAAGIVCPDGTYSYTWNGYSGCCANPIQGSPCGRRDCLIHVDACDTGPQ